MQAKFSAFRKSLSGETDRGCALFAASYLDQALSDLLFLNLVENKHIDKDLFEGTSPLATFSSRITMAFYIGKLSPQMRRELNLIRKIRNEFAHSAENISFESDAIANRCRELQYSYHEPDQRPRGHFTASVCGVLATIQMTGLQSSAMIEKPDDTLNQDEKQKLRTQVAEEFGAWVHENANSNPDGAE